MKNGYSAIYCFEVKEYMVYFGDDHVGYFSPNSGGIEMYDDNVRMELFLTKTHLNQLMAIMKLQHEIDDDCED
jgi:hypothetical protein